MTTDPTVERFKKAEGHRLRLQTIIADVLVVADGLKAASAPAIRKIDERVSNEAFRIMVVGEFKRGKSTLINSLLGGNILPAYARPATAVLTELRWSAEPTAVLHPADGGPPLPVKVVDLNAHITIPKGVRQGAAETSRWKLAEVGWPLDLLQNRVILIDSPGLNEHPARQAVTLEYLNRADAIVFVQDSQHAMSIEESRFMKAYLDTYDVFFVFNKINYIPEHERRDIVDEALFRVREHRDEQRRDRFFFVNALAALQARINGDDAGWRASAVAGFVDELSTFLGTERHRAKLIGPARDLNRDIRLLRVNVADQQTMLEQKEADLRQRYEDAQSPLRRLKTRAEQIRQELDVQQRHLRAVFRAEVANRLIRMSTETTEIVEGITPDAELSLAPWKAKSTAEAYAEQLSQLASEEAGTRFKTWQREELSATLEPELSTMARRADDLIQEFMRDLAQVREEITGVNLSAGAEHDILDGGGLASADLEAMNLVGGLAVGRLLGQLAATYGVMLVWAFTPFGFIPLIIGVLLANAAVLGFAKGRIERKVRTEIAAVLSKKMREDAEANAERSAQVFGATVRTVVDDLMTRIDGQLRQLQIDVEDTLGTLGKGEDAVRQRREQLVKWDEVLERDKAAIEDLISDVALT